MFVRTSQSKKRVPAPTRLVSGWCDTAGITWCQQVLFHRSDLFLAQDAQTNSVLQRAAAKCYKVVPPGS